MTEPEASRHLAVAGQSPLTEDGPHVLCLTPADPPTDTAFARALEVASPQGVVVLFDRRDESWRPDDDATLVDADDERVADLEEVARARELADVAGIGLAVWGSITPALGTGILQAVQTAGITDIVVPADGHQAATGDRLLGGEESIAAAIASLLEKPVVTETGRTPELHVVEVDPGDG